MNIELGLKGLIPVGSAMIGAVIGGIITYKMNKAKVKKGFKNVQNLFWNYKLS
ncbi:hypothetical protein AAHH71_20525 [Bacillus toyonensis]|nr:hypothetical protein [Bacillus toyonensis]HDR7837721.1 hypothetical protein [Bacillus toyonensis]